MTSESRQAEGRMSVTTEHMLIAVDDKETAPQGVQLHSYSELFREDGMSDSVSRGGVSRGGVSRGGDSVSRGGG